MKPLRPSPPRGAAYKCVDAEITDKGYINQRAVLTRRTAAVAVLSDDASPAWIGRPT
jgi:hypothetical protein